MIVNREYILKDIFYLPSSPTITTVVLSGPNPTRVFMSSGSRNCANDHSELKYFGSTPAMNQEMANPLNHPKAMP